MGILGYKLYQDDVAVDVRDEFVSMLKKGMDCQTATTQIINSNIDIIKDEDDAPVFWFALADTQWKYGILLDTVKETALFYLENGENLKKWQEQAPKEAKKRAEILELLKKTLLSPQPPVKKISIIKQYRCEWKIGDTYAYPITSELSKEYGLYGEYFLFHKVGERIYYPEHIIPIVWVKITQNKHLPQNKEEFDSLQYIKTDSFRDENSIKIELSQPDENGFYSYYSIALVSTSKRIIPKSLIFLGNFKNVIPPSMEAVPKHVINFTTLSWRCCEEKLLQIYSQFNLNNI